MSDPKNWASEFPAYSDFQRFQAQGAALRVEFELGEFNKLLGWLAGSGLKVQEELLRYAFIAERRIAMRTPVKTGRAQNSWHVIEPGKSDDYTYSDNQGRGFNGALSDLGQLGPFEAVVGTNVEYMISLEAGHSRQAPAGMVAVTLAELSGALEARLEEIFRQMSESDGAD